MLIDLAFIKAVNGLFYFALDYLAELQDVTSVVLVRSPALAAVVRERFPNVPVRVAGVLQAAATTWAASRRGEMVFTPSPHPIPCCSRQMVVVHDTFPFDGRAGAVKKALFFLAMHSASASAGYINRSDAHKFLLRGGLDRARLLPSPNRMALPANGPSQKPLVLSEQPVVGLFGTDSSKKNYHQLFAAIALYGPPSRLAFRLYGQCNDYAAGVIAAFPELDIRLADVGTDLEMFVRSVDIVASAATREGFSRPMALALSLGIPCWIVDAPVFREFYGDAAVFYTGTVALGSALATLTPGMALERPHFALPVRLEQDFRHCIAWLKAQDTPRP